ncbi:TIGR02186 family protein [Pseudooceanicola sp.]|uniref:TIGR02186 family protein n=1 Tax=Pseudooceanicola sp. TaxID=1914328 RepID=UPI0026393CEC|nr:TIGR02186 family protein [Pseudooceanicola sp.]MDF1854674.1 TIGR02186 family protein [Pseudooceanicola sp.]
MSRTLPIWAVCLGLGLGLGALIGTASAREDVVLGLSQNRVQINANFDGSEILIFGAVKREAQIPATPLEAVITVAGPSAPVVVHRKARRVGIWVNAETVQIDSAPSFYAVATTGAMHSVLSYTEDLRHAITVPRAVRSVGAEAEDPASYTEALIRIREADGLYATLENAVVMEQQTLFRTRIALPSNLTEGGYQVRVFLTRDRQVVSQLDTIIDVRKVGLERWLFALAQDQSLIYGLLSLVLAVLAGWGASAGFRLLRG